VTENKRKDMKTVKAKAVDDAKAKSARSSQRHEGEGLGKREEVG
jgi:hypothetical protein